MASVIRLLATPPEHQLGLHTGPDQVDDVNAQCNRKALDVVDGDVALTALNRSDVGAVNSGEVGKFFLRKAAFPPEQPEVGSNPLPGGGLARGASVHLSRFAGMMLLGLQTLSSIMLSPVLKQSTAERLGSDR
jgi:hypothetical protein